MVQEENYILRDQLRKNEETRRMYSIEKSGMKHKLDQGERSLQQAHDRNAKLMVRRTRSKASIREWSIACPRRHPSVAANTVHRR